MKISRKLKYGIIIGIAAALILYGVLERFLKFNIDQKVVDNVSMVLMILAFGLLFSRGKQPGNGEQSNSETEVKADESQIEQTVLENDMIKGDNKEATNNDDSRNDLRS